ncbi:hypothetical protein [Pedobacter agri]|uniref:Uncharacterized protein n=1 Tax=Pedobacter agri TaxID=454586 RepID=A0A9X3DA78_9SPHI|nr:hypothetical protein [Pedobacter agri]MCX3263747.1 hypothetical protein [Pedobacter agri]
MNQCTDSTTNQDSLSADTIHDNMTNTPPDAQKRDSLFDIGNWVGQSLGIFCF